MANIVAKRQQSRNSGQKHCEIAGEQIKAIYKPMIAAEFVSLIKQFLK